MLSLERGTLRLTRLIDNLLESVRIESGQLDVRRQSIELADVVDDARALVEALLRQRRQPLEVDVPEGLELQGDATRLTQVFVNLIANASKFAPEGTRGARGRARATASRSAPGSRMRVPGLPEGDAVEHLRTLQARRLAGTRAGWPGAGAVDLAFDRRTPRGQHHRRRAPPKATRASRSHCR